MYIVRVDMQLRQQPFDFLGGLWFFFLDKFFFSPAAKNNLFFSQQVENNVFLSILALHIVAAEGVTNNFFFRIQNKLFFSPKTGNKLFFPKKTIAPPENQMVAA